MLLGKSTNRKRDTLRGCLLCQWTFLLKSCFLNFFIQKLSRPHRLVDDAKCSKYAKLYKNIWDPILDKSYKENNVCRGGGGWALLAPGIHFLVKIAKFGVPCFQ